MTTVNVYLNFDGNCLEAFNFYKSVFGGDFSYISRYKEMPSSDEPGCEPMSEEMGDRIMHISLPISNETTLMGSDTGGEWAPKLHVGNNFSLSINTDTMEEADRLFIGLSADGKITMPMGKTFWGDYFGMFTDKFEVNWMISFAENKEAKG